MNTQFSDDKQAFDAAIRSLEAQLANAGAHMVIDVHARQLYSAQIKKMSNELSRQILSGKIIWKQAAEEAQEARNIIMGLIRSKSTPVGLAEAQKLKRKGRTLNDLIEKKINELYGKQTN